MSGMFMAMACASMGKVQAPNQSVESDAVGPTGSSTASVSFNSDGTVTGGATGGAGHTITVYPWYTTAPTAGIGSYYWISINGGAWTSLSANPGASLSGTNNSWTHAYSIASDSGGSNVLGTGTIYLTVANSA